MASPFKAAHPLDGAFEFILTTRLEGDVVYQALVRMREVFDGVPPSTIKHTFYKVLTELEIELGYDK